MAVLLLLFPVRSKQILEANRETSKYDARLFGMNTRKTRSKTNPTTSIPVTY